MHLNWPGGQLIWQRPGGLPGQVKRHDGKVQIGPVIGIMTTGVRNDRMRPVGIRTGLLGDFVRAAKELDVLCYIFNAADIDWQARTVRGVTLVGPSGNERWSFQVFPLPDVVYNRVPHRKAEVADDVMRCKRRCQELQIPLFNERFINKREMYNWLLRDATTKDLIPVTERLTTADTLARFCKQHALVYLKPTGGSLGMGIIRVVRKGQVYNIRFRRDKGHRNTTFSTAPALYRFVRSYNATRTYLMQQGIELMQYKGNATDFRVHMHKDGSGQWQAAGIGGKVAGRGAVTTHVHNGGHVLAGDVILRDWYGADAKRMRQQLIESSVRVCRSLEGLLQGPVGEWGLDAGIDQNGRIWIFEANAKPGRAIFKHPDLREAGRRSARFAIEYAATLAGQPLRKEGAG